MRSLCLASTLLVAAVLGLSGCPDPKSSTVPPTPPAAPPAPVAPLVHKAQVSDWCKEHGVSESVCTRCNESLIPEFKKKGDWCAKHNLPDSQCITCHPELEAKLKALAPKEEKK